MQITEKANKYLTDHKIGELTVIEVEMKTCCSTQKVPRISIGRNFLEGERISERNFDNITFFFVGPAQKYVNSGIVDLKDRYLAFL